MDLNILEGELIENPVWKSADSIKYNNVLVANAAQLQAAHDSIDWLGDAIYLGCVSIAGKGVIQVSLNHHHFAM
ncbi:unnamed protein product [marine sediment metagenome]|uniref:Uncharacterized protein n=1 Tax=marine sediment metagenome TaxID=412755 RepID=X1GUM5_9ZZZZ